MIHPETIESPYINYIVLSLAIVFEGAAWLFALKEFNRTRGKLGYVEAVQRGKDPSLFVVLFEDSAAMLGLVVAMVGIFLAQLTGLAWFDGLASVIIGLILGGTAWWLAYETKGLLIGEAANQKVIQGIRRLTSEIPHIGQVNEVLTMHMGPDFVLVNISADFNDSVQAGEIEKAIAQLDLKIKEQFPEVKRVFVEAEAGKQT